MDGLKIQELRAAVLRDLAEFIPNNFYVTLHTNMDVYYKDCELARQLRISQWQSPKMTPRQLVANWLLDRIGMYASADDYVPADAAADFANGITLEGIKETSLALLQEALSRYAAYLSPDEARALLANHAAPATEAAKVPASPLDAFRAMPDLTADELTIAFVGDKDDFRLGVNNSLEISARDIKHTVPLALLGLVTIKGKTLNAQGAILMQMALKTELPKNNATSQKIRRLKGIFRDCLGIKSNPFDPKGAGWKPRFKIIDKCGVADERARRAAERRTVSYEQMNEGGNQFAVVDEFGVPEDDPGSEYLRNI
jgi:hypothetical protein